MVQRVEVRGFNGANATLASGRQRRMQGQGSYGCSTRPGERDGDQEKGAKSVDALRVVIFMSTSGSSKSSSSHSCPLPSP